VSLPLQEGRFIDGRDDDTHAQVCVIGSGARRDLFGAEPALGQDMKVNDVWCEVIGVARGRGAGGQTLQGVSIGSTAREIYMPVHDRDPQVRARPAEIAPR